MKSKCRKPVLAGEPNGDVSNSIVASPLPFGMNIAAASEEVLVPFIAEKLQSIVVIGASLSERLIFAQCSFPPDGAFTVITLFVFPATSIVPVACMCEGGAPTGSELKFDWNRVTDEQPVVSIRAAAPAIVGKIKDFERLLIYLMISRTGNCNFRFQSVRL